MSVHPACPAGGNAAESRTGAGTCETESISIQKGESLTLPEAAFEGHYLESWADITENDGVTKFTAVGRAGDTIIVLKDCSVSKTLEVTADNVTLKSEDAENPVTVRREEEFTGKKYAKDAGNVLVGISSGSLATQDIILDGGGVYMSTGNQAKLIRCTITENKTPRGSAIQTGQGEGILPLVIRDCTITGNRSGEKIHAGGTICYMNEAGIILSGHIVMEDNLSVGYEPCDIHYFYNTGASILLDEDFESDSTFVLGGYDTIKPGRVLIDGTLYHKNASTEQFVWHCRNYCTEKRGENLYLAEVLKTYFFTYDANNNPGGSSIMCSDPNDYTSEDIVVIMGEAELFPLMGNLVNFGYDFDGWNTQADGKGTDYAPGQEINLTDDLYLYAKWKAKDPVTLTYIYNGICQV